MTIFNLAMLTLRRNTIIREERLALVGDARQTTKTPSCTSKRSIWLEDTSRRVNQISKLVNTDVQIPDKLFQSDLHVKWTWNSFWVSPDETEKRLFHTRQLVSRHHSDWWRPFSAHWRRAITALYHSQPGKVLPVLAHSLHTQWYFGGSILVRHRWFL